MNAPQAEATGAEDAPSDADTGPSDADTGPSQADRDADQSQVAHRIEELLHGIQTTLFAQEMAAQQQLQSIADVWAATDRYRVAALAARPFPLDGKDAVAPATPESQPR